MPSDPPRRGVLSALGAIGLPAAAGCLGDSGSGGDDPSGGEGESDDEGADGDDAGGSDGGGDAERDDADGADTDEDVTVDADRTVVVGPDGRNEFDPDRLEIDPGSTVAFVWDSDSHNVNPTSQPDGADWEGHAAIEDEGFAARSTFEVEGEYEYVCDPHVGLGMTGTIGVGAGTDDGGDDGDDGAGTDDDGAGGDLVEIGVVDNAFDPDVVTIEPGTTVRWSWEGENPHNVVPTEQPDGADWTGHLDLRSDGEYEHTFDVEGEYGYVCDPHAALGMEGEIVVRAP